MVFQNPVAAFDPMMTIGATLVDAMRLRGDLASAAKQAGAARLLLGVRRSYQICRR
jgi:ABC-type glutathione transport system ATPase component